MRTLEVHFHRGPQDAASLVGTLAERQGSIFFEYDGGWLKTGMDLSPFRLPFAAGIFEHRDRSFGPLPGVFDDSLPDGWGRLLMDRHFRSLGGEPGRLGPLERLAWLGTRTMGALTYHPPAGPEFEGSGPFDLGELARQSQEVLAGTSREVLPQLLRAGGSPGGARPKVLVGFDPVTEELRSGEVDLPEGWAHWMVKFHAGQDAGDAGRAEFAYALMAVAAGLAFPAARLFATPGGGAYFGVQRFDRAGNQRFHCHTFGNLIQTDFRVPSCDYGDLLKATALLTRSHDEVLKAFRRMVFNVYAHNRDDHAKNFSFILDEGSGWGLTPAYDLSFSHGPGGEHSMTVAGEGKAPKPEHFLRLASARGIAKAAAVAIMDEVRTALGGWPQFAERAGLSESTAMTIGALLVK